MMNSLNSAQNVKYFQLQLNDELSSNTIFMNMNPFFKYKNIFNFNIKFLANEPSSFDVSFRKFLADKILIRRTFDDTIRCRVKRAHFAC